MFALVSSQVSEVKGNVQGVDPLVEACRTGQPGAFRALYEAHFDFAWRTARRLGLPESDVDDVVQESFAIAWQGLHRFTYGRFSTWLYRIVANLVAERLRRLRVRDFFSGLLKRSQPEQEETIAGHLEARQSLRNMELLLRKMSREKREVFVLFEIEGLSHQEIAELTGVKVETVRSRLHYARKNFERLAEEVGMSP